MTGLGPPVVIRVSPIEQLRRGLVALRVLLAADLNLFAALVQGKEDLLNVVPVVHINAPLIDLGHFGLSVVDNELV